MPLSPDLFSTVTNYIATGLACQHIFQII